MAKSEWEKMLDGEEYYAAEQSMIDKIAETRLKIWEYNSLRPDMQERKESVLRSMLGRAGRRLNVVQPFFCDYGIHISVGENFFANFNFTVLDEARVTIGDNAFIGPNVNIYTAVHPIDPERRNAQIQSAKPVSIGDNVWIGGNTTILPGVTVGDNVTIGAGSVVTRDIPSDCVVAGNPARVIRRIK